MPDYSEFPTTPTAWQEAQWEEVRRFETEEMPHPAPPHRRAVDLVALVPGVLFTVLALVLMTGVDLPGALFRGGGLVWVLLIGAGVLLLLSEVRKLRRR